MIEINEAKWNKMDKTDVVTPGTIDIEEPAPGTRFPGSRPPRRVRSTTPTRSGDRGAGSGTPCRAHGWRWPSCACRSPPRWCRGPGAFQGLVAGITGAIGYGLGVLGARVWREFADRPERPPRPRSWRVFQIAAPSSVLVSYLLGQRWQGQIRDLVQAPNRRRSGRNCGCRWWRRWSFVGLVAAARGIRRFFWWVAGLLSRWMGRRAARALGWVLAAVLTVGLVSGVLVDGILAVTDRIFAVRDTTTSDTAVQPTTPLRSGGPGSLVAWDTLG